VKESLAHLENYGILKFEMEKKDMLKTAKISLKADLEEVKIVMENWDQMNN
jgi:hypothetical protein